MAMFAFGGRLDFARNLSSWLSSLISGMLISGLGGAEGLSSRKVGVSENFFGGNSFFRVELHQFLEKVSGNRVNLGLFEVGGEICVPPGAEASAFDRFPSFRVLPKSVFSKQSGLHGQQMFLISGRSKHGAADKEFEENAAEAPEVGAMVVATWQSQQLLRRAVGQSRRFSEKQPTTRGGSRRLQRLRTFRVGGGVGGGLERRRGEEALEAGEGCPNKRAQSERVRKVRQNHSLRNPQIGNANVEVSVSENIGGW